MYTHILVPLDGSHLSEQVLPHVLAQASIGQDTRITLLRAMPFYHPALIEGQVYFETRAEEVAAAEQAAKRYLEQIADKIRTSGYQVQIEVSHLPPAEAIVDYAEQHNVDLITIATHGRSGMSRWLLGSVTQKVLHATDVPTLVVRPYHEATDPS